MAKRVLQAQQAQLANRDLPAKRVLLALLEKQVLLVKSELTVKQVLPEKQALLALMAKRVLMVKQVQPGQPDQLVQPA